jgi:hypothetical protein
MVSPVIQVATNSLAVAGSESVTATFAETPAEGNLLLAIGFAFAGDGTPNANDGWAVDPAYVTSPTTVITIYVGYRYAGASEPTTQSPIYDGEEQWGLSIFEITGVTGVWATDGVAFNLNANAGHGTNVGAISGFSTAGAGNLLVAAFSCDNGTPSATITPSVVPSAPVSSQATGTHVGEFSTYAISAASVLGQFGAGTSVSGAFVSDGSPTVSDMHYGFVEIAVKTNTDAVGTAAGAGAAVGVGLRLVKIQSVGTAAGAGAAVGVTESTLAEGSPGGPIIIIPALGGASGVVVEAEPPPPPPPPPLPFPMSQTLLLDVGAWDLTVDIDGNIAVASLPYSAVQDACSAVRLYLGELWYDTTQGVPYAQILGLQANLSFLKLQFSRAALTVPAVLEATAYITGLSNRALTGQIDLVIEGGATASISINATPGSAPAAFIVGHSKLSGGDVS